jgi:hypothetical protein
MNKKIYLSNSQQRLIIINNGGKNKIDYLAKLRVEVKNYRL